MDYVAIACRSILAVVFVVSCASKLRTRQTYREFLQAVRGYSGLDRGIGRAVGGAVVALELFVALIMIVDRLTVVGYLVATLLLLVFTGAIALSLGRGSNISCACFGPSTPGYGQLIRNVVLLGVSVAGLLLTSTSQASVPLAGNLLALVSGAVIASVLIQLDVIIDLFVGKGRTIS